MISFDQITLAESIAVGILILVVVGIGVFNRGVLLSEAGRLALKKNLGKLRVIVLLSLMSLYLYIFGEMIYVATGLNILATNYQSFHDVAEMLHLALLFVSFAVGLQILMVMRGGGSR